MDSVEGRLLESGNTKKPREASGPVSHHLALYRALPALASHGVGAFRLGDKPSAHNLKQKQGSPTLYPVDQVELARFADRDRRTCADLLAQLVPNAQRSHGVVFHGAARLLLEGRARVHG
jgi:hypothetical protein